MTLKSLINSRIRFARNSNTWRETSSPCWQRPTCSGSKGTGSRVLWTLWQRIMKPSWSSSMIRPWTVRAEEAYPFAHSGPDWRPAVASLRQHMIACMRTIRTLVNLHNWTMHHTYPSRDSAGACAWGHCLGWKAVLEQRWLKVICVNISSNYCVSCQWKRWSWIMRILENNEIMLIIASFCNN